MERGVHVRIVAVRNPDEQSMDESACVPTRHY